MSNEHQSGTWQRSERTWLIALIAVSAIVGLGVPAFYDWTGADQSRPVALMWQVPLGFAVVNVALAVALIWIPIAKRVEESARFSMGALIAMAVAVASGIVLWLSFPAIIGGVCLAAAWLAGIWLLIQRPTRRLAVVTLFACSYLPLLWLIGNPPPIRWWELFALTGFPALLPAMMINSWIAGNSPDAGLSIALLCTAVLLAGGLGLVRYTVKAAIAYMLVVVALSSTGSLMMNAMMRM